MFMSEVNYTSMESSPQEEVSYSDVENVAMSPDDHRIDVVNVEQSPFDDRSSVKSARNGDCTRSWTMAKVQVGYDITRKGERSLVVDGFKFTKSRDGTNNRVFWRCSRRECKATAVTVCDRVEHVRAIHQHEPPLAAEFFGSQEGVSQRCQLQEVRFNTSAANMRPRYRRSTVSGSDNVDDSTIAKDISNSNGVIGDKKPLGMSLVTAQPIFQIQTADQKPAVFQRTPSVKEQVRDFILRNSSNSVPQPQQQQQIAGNQIDNSGGNNNVSVAQFLISPAAAASQQTAQFIQTSTTTPISTASTIFNFSTMHINASPNAGSDSTSDAPSHKSTPGLINLPSTPKDPVTDAGLLNQLNLEQIIHMLLNKNTGAATNRQRSCSDSEWIAAGTNCGIGGATIGYEHDAPELSLSAIAVGPSVSATGNPARFIHWKKEKLRESETTCDEQLRRDRKRRHDDEQLIDSSPIVTHGSRGSRSSDDAPPMMSRSNELCSFLNSFRPTITHKLMGVMQKLSAELCPEEAVAQEVFEKCTAIKTCLETLEKLHSFMTY